MDPVKVTIAAVVFVALIVTLVAFMKKLLAKATGKPKTKIAEGQTVIKKQTPMSKLSAVIKKSDALENALTSAQDAIGLSDIQGQHAILSDGSIISIVEISCKNTNLYTRIEKERAATHAERIVGALKEGFCLIKLHRMVDNSSQVAEYHSLIKNAKEEIRVLETRNLTPAISKRIEYVQARLYVLNEKLEAELMRCDKAALQMSDQTVICFRTAAGTDVVKRAAKATKAFVRRCFEEGYPAQVLSGIEIIDVLKAYFDEPSNPRTNINPFEQTPIVRRAHLDQINDDMFGDLAPVEPIVQSEDLRRKYA